MQETSKLHTLSPCANGSTVDSIVHSLLCARLCATENLTCLLTHDHHHLRPTIKADTPRLHNNNNSDRSIDPSIVRSFVLLIGSTQYSAVAAAASYANDNKGGTAVYPPNGQPTSYLVCSSGETMGIACPAECL